MGLIDDAALLTPPQGRQLVVTTDGLTAGVHFPFNEDPRDVAARLIGVNLSDLAAMGAEPWVYTLALALPDDWEPNWLTEFSGELKDQQERFAIHLVGGDTTRTSGPMTLSLTALGTVPEGGGLQRSRACAGDRIYVSGTIGDAALGLSVLSGELDGLDNKNSQALLARYHRPEPRVSLGQRLRGLANAAIDISDGLIADLGHVALESSLSAVLNTDQVPFSEAALAAFALNPGFMEQALTGGDDYELLFSVPETATAGISALEADIGLALTLIGTLSDSNELGHVTVLGDEGQVLPINKSGYRHF